MNSPFSDIVLISFLLAMQEIGRQLILEKEKGKYSHIFLIGYFWMNFWVKILQVKTQKRNEEFTWVALAKQKHCNEKHE